MNISTHGIEPEPSLEELNEIRRHLLEDYRDNKAFLQVDLDELESFFSQRPCIACQVLFLTRMSIIIQMVQEMVQFQAEIQKDEHH